MGAIVIGLAVVAPAAGAPQSELPDGSHDARTVLPDIDFDQARLTAGEGVEPAAVAADFDPGYLASDYAFYNRVAMTEAEIQAFLDARIDGPCTTAYCLVDYRTTTSSKPVTERCDGYTGAPNESAARIIYKVQVSCSISAKVLLVTLQKEQSLISRTNPSERTLERAMGYYCPDDPSRPGWCHPDYAGFFNQVYNAASQFQRYRLNPGSYNHGIRTQAVRFHPSTACGSRQVTIRNAATAGLYNYTPYTPNAAAISNLYSTGDGCSTYGNRNFWRLYTDWFGSPTTLVPSGVQTQRLAGPDRYATAIEVSRSAYPEGAPTVYIAVGSNFPDGLAAAPAAAAAGGPLLMVRKSAIPASVRTELLRLSPSKVVIVGSEGVVGASVMDELAALLPGAETTRHFGPDRYSTAAAVAEGGFESAPIAFIATGENFPDALAASAAAGHLGGPVLLVSSAQAALDTRTVNLLTGLGVTTIAIAGSSAVVSIAMEQSLSRVPGVTTVVRLEGRDRFSTAVALNTYAFDKATTGYIASGWNFPDALGAAAAAGAIGAPVHLSNGVCTITPSLQHLVDAEVSTVRFIGSSAVLRSTVTEFLTCG
ncbi:MAG: cell wall-binding repeat-containing protein [Microcella pacifica]|uniref:cell wall-binding repeat-containing protein n=1 Tax=Microcella pacifica TaxID=2591847 RepID=UPI003315E6B8